MKFTVTGARATKDVDFLLNVIALRDEPLQLAAILKGLGYVPLAGLSNFQFEKPIPNSSETMRIEFMAPEIQAEGRLPRGRAGGRPRPRLYRRIDRSRRIGSTPYRL